MNDFETYCFQMIYGNLNIHDFEQWVYDNTDVLSELLSGDDYLELISINYNEKSTKYEVEKLLEKYIDYSRFETIKIRTMLQNALNSRDSLPIILMEFYEMYCDGYYFLEDLGLGYGLACVVPQGNYKANSWDELEHEEQEKLVTNFFPGLEHDLKRALT